MGGAAQQQCLPFSITSVVEDVLHQQTTTRPRNLDLASRRIEEDSNRRYEATEWLRKMVGVVYAKDLPSQPSEEEFRLGLRSGIILCNVLNKVQPGAVPKVVEAPCDSVIIPDGAALSAYQYFENVRNFLVAVEELGVPTFESSDLEQGGKSARLVNCVLALKSYGEWKQSGAVGTWKYSANLKPPVSAPFMRKNSEPFMSSILRSQSLNSIAGDQTLGDDLGQDLSETGKSLGLVLRAALANRKQDDIPNIVESMLNKVVEEFQSRLTNQNTNNQQMKANDEIKDTKVTNRSASNDELKDRAVTNGVVSPRSVTSPGRKHGNIRSSNPTEEQASVKTAVEKECRSPKDYDFNKELKNRLMKPQMIVQRQQICIKELNHTLQSLKEGMHNMQIQYRQEFVSLGQQLCGLANAAQGYKRVLEENRKLYNQVQDLKGNIRVYCRVRPFLPGQPDLINTTDHIEETSITINTPVKYGKDGRKSFTFNKVFGPSASQAEVFADTQPLIRSVLDGYNVCIFAYGQTGSGKTYTMTGPNDLTEETVGVNYRALNDLFLLSEQRKDVVKYEITAQMLEIYNEQVRDLLANDSLTKRLEIRNSTSNGINVPDACLVPVTCPSDVLNLMETGFRNRAVSATAMNDRSSRSHSCLTVHVQGRELTSGSIVRGSMHLVDLAGSERVDKSEVTGDRLKEAQHINKSLSALGDVIASLAMKHAHVPYRNSKLTQLLQDSLGGQAKTLMFVHISPEHEAVGETISTLKFAERVATVELGAARVNKDGNNPEVKELKEQIASLKAAMGRKDTESESSQQSRSSSPDKNRVKSALPLPSQRSIGNPRRRSLDPSELQNNSSAWPPAITPSKKEKEEDKQSTASAEWVDKAVVNKEDKFTRCESLPAELQTENNQSIEMLNAKVYPELPSSKSLANKKDNQECDSQRSRNETVSTADSEELEVGTSDSSEADLSYLPRVNSLPTVIGGAKPAPKKSYAKALKGSDNKSMIPSLIPAPTRKVPNGATPTKAGRQLISADAKRKTK